MPEAPVVCGLACRTAAVMAAPHEVYEQVSEGSPVILTVGSGNLGIEWISANCAGPNDKGRHYDVARLSGHGTVFPRGHGSAGNQEEREHRAERTDVQAT